jgi:hypothetical protein
MMRNVARLLFATLVVLTVVIAGSPATAETTQAAPLSVAPASPAFLPSVQQAPLRIDWLALSTGSGSPQPTDPCIETFDDGTCWYSHDLCSGWCTWSCPWGDSQGPC